MVILRNSNALGELNVYDNDNDITKCIYLLIYRNITSI